MTSTRARKLTFAVMSTAILMAVIAVLLFATPNGAFAAGPERPTDLVATAVDHDTVSLTWSHPDPTTVDHYQVLSRTVGASTRLLQVGTSTTTSFEHDGLEPESTYRYRVKPVNSAGEEGRRSARAEATTPAEETPAPPANPTPEPDPTPERPPRGHQAGHGPSAIAVSNTGKGNSGTITIGSNDYAQAFTTGSSTSGYDFDSVVLDLGNAATGSGTLTVTVRDDASGDPSSTVLYTLTNPTSIQGNTPNTFTAPANASLDGDSTYWVVATYSADSGGQNWWRTNISNGVDSSSAAGWSINTAYKQDSRTSPDGWAVGSSTRAMQMQIKLTAESFVSNTGQDDVSGGAVAGTTTPRAQQFQTGTNTGGYTLAEIVVNIKDGRTGVPAFALYTSTADDKPATSIVALDGDSSTTGLQAFTPATATTLAASTKYFIVFSMTSGDANLQRTASNNVDSGAATGWDIAEASFYSTNSGTTWTSSGSSVEIAITGIVVVSAPTLSTDATLSDLELADNNNTNITLTPTFASGTTTYTANVVNSVDEITIMPSVNDSNATYEVQNNSGTALTDSDTGTAGFQVDLSVGANIIKVEVEAEDASTETYTVTVTRATAATPVSNVLVSNTGQTSADFTTDAIDYGQGFTTGSDTAGYTLDAIDIGYNDSSNTAFSASIWSSFIADGSPNSLLYSLTPPATFSAGNLTFTAPANATLTSDTTYFIILALADAGSITIKRTATINSNEDADAAAGWSIANTYVFYSGGWGTSSSNKPLLVAVKGTVYAGSNDATLSALTVNDGTNDLTLTPTFVSGTYAYEADVGNAVTTVTLSDTLNDDTAEITGVTLGGTATIADTDLTDGITVPSLLVGDNEIVVTVTAEDASTQTYTVTVTRAAAATPTVSISADKTTAVYREDTITYTLTRIGSTAAALPVSVTFTQTKDFLATTELTKTVTIPAGQTTETFTVAAFSFQHFATGTAVEAGTLTATVQDGTDYDLGTSPSVAVNIVIGPMIRIEHASYSVIDAAGALIVQVIARTGPGAPQPTVNTNTVVIRFEDVTTIEGTDYSTIQGDTFLFETGGFSMDGTEWKSAKPYHISITPDDIDEDDETFLLVIDYLNNNFLKNILVDSSGNACDPVDGCKVTVTIVDDDTAGVSVSKSAITVTEENTTGDTYTVVLDSSRQQMSGSKSAGTLTRTSPLFRT